MIKKRNTCNKQNISRRNKLPEKQTARNNKQITCENNKTLADENTILASFRIACEKPENCYNVLGDVCSFKIFHVCENMHVNCQMLHAIFKILLVIIQNCELILRKSKSREWTSRLCTAGSKYYVPELYNCRQHLNCFIKFALKFTIRKHTAKHELTEPNNIFRTKSITY